MAGFLPYAHCCFLNQHHHSHPQPEQTPTPVPWTLPSSSLLVVGCGRKKTPGPLQTAEGWEKFTGGFFFGGISGVIWAYFLLYGLNLPYYVK
uniref:PSI subunit V n=1 Tax=Kalanchoe fedtschenkoi TaxID=63787 RepID=A0A7N0TBN4_KALFE